MNKPIKIAVLGSGGREHAIAWKLANDLCPENVYVLPGNAGIPNSHPMDLANFQNIKKFCIEHEIQWIFVGPEQPLAEGIVDYFLQTDIQVLGPDATSAKLESSKIFSKEFMKKYGVASAPFKKFANVKEAYHIVAQRPDGFVIKLDGLAGGKGVFVCNNEAEGMEALKALSDKYGAKVDFIIENKIIGDEVSIIGFTDGKSIQLLQPSQDHKQLLDGDMGPNTGGMGAYCPVPQWSEWLAKEIQTRIIQPTLKGIQAEGMNYKGIIYFGIMISEEGPFLLEYNVRLGDPETEVLMPSLKSSLFELMEATLTGKLNSTNLVFENGFFVDVVLASGGYPLGYKTGYPIEMQKTEQDVLIFNAGVSMNNNQLVTNGGRVLNIVASGITLDEAIDKVYKNIRSISFQDAIFRKDIGQRENKVLSAKRPQI